MEKKILFIREASNFLVNAMVMSLKNAGFSVESLEPDSSDAEKILNSFDSILIYMEGNQYHFEKIYGILKKFYENENSKTPLFIIGNQAELELAYKFIQKIFISAIFTRPVNMQDVIARLDFQFNKNKNYVAKKSLLVVDDDGVMLRTMNNWFSKKYEVFLANSGTNAISALAQHKIDLILLDYEMPVVSGLQVFEMIRNEPSTAKIPVIFLTGKDDKETVLKVVSAKPEKYLLKTMPPEALIKAVDDFLSGESH